MTTRWDVSSDKLNDRDAISARTAWVLEELRDRLGLSQNKVASAMGVSQGYLSQIIRGKSATSVAVVSGLASKFSVSPRWYLLGEGEPWELSSEVLPGSPMVVREPTPPAYAADVDPTAVYVDGQRVTREDAVVHRNLQVLLVAGEPYRSGLVRYVDALARTVEAEAGLIQPRDAPHHEGQHAPGVGQGSAGGRKQSA